VSRGAGAWERFVLFLNNLAAAAVSPEGPNRLVHAFTAAVRRGRRGKGLINLGGRRASKRQISRAVKRPLRPCVVLSRKGRDL
jgi:hypothetical protein